MREHELHRAAAEYLDLVLPSGAVHAAIDHAGKATKTVGAMLKARGGRKGFPDHIVLHAGQAAFLEFKSTKGRLSQEQVAMHHKLKAAGFSVAIVRSLPELELALSAFGIIARGRLVA